MSQPAGLRVKQKNGTEERTVEERFNSTDKNTRWLRRGPSFSSDPNAQLEEMSGIIRSRLSEAFIPEDVSLPQFVLEELERHGDRTAFIVPETGTKFTFVQMADAIRKLSAGLAKKGVQKETMVGICSSNCPQFMQLALAVPRLGATFTTANPAYTQEELEKQYANAAVEFIFTQREYLPKITPLKRLLPTLKEIFIIDGDPKDRNSFQYILKSGENAACPLPAINPRETVAYILYSSGTTGLPKGVMLTHRNIVANLCQATSCRQQLRPEDDVMFKFERGDRVLSSFPFFHVGGLVCGGLWQLVQGATSVVLPKYDSEKFLGAIQKYQVTVVIVPPPIMVFLAKSKLVDEFDLSSLRATFTGAAPVPLTIAEQVRQRLKTQWSIQGYGMTEVGPLSHLAQKDAASQTKLASCGPVLRSMECKVVDPESGAVCGVGKPGELWVHGPNVMKGYFRNPEATRQTMTADGWLKTGDIGYYDSNEVFYIIDRLKELIKVRGFQVAPAELEELLLKHQKVAEALVIGVPDDYAGELPRAYIVLKPGVSATKAEIQDFIKEHVASYKRLEGGVEFLQELPKTPSGKLLRRLMRDKVRKEVAGQKSKL